MAPSASDHHAEILDQFTRQAVPFATAPGIKNEQALSLVVDLAGAGASDTVLDVACGPGLLACAFARVARHVTGIDLTPAMLEQARKNQREQGLTNLSWQLGDVLPLPFPDTSFTIVSARFALHHLLDPRAVLAEMARVCAPGGRVVVADSAPAPDKAAAFNHMEKLRDPSHVRALPLEELRRLYRAVGLPEPRVTTYGLEGDLESLLGRSFPAPGGADEIRRLFAASLADDALGIATRREGDRIHYAYPVAVLVAARGAA
ncbi:MAG: methyltransferase domain-containing protein [Candidatus Rokubacteria bacterium]|nr:methyltransferase domain-containing protein [Candidatus Rokubacteria bacterium]